MLTKLPIIGSSISYNDLLYAFMYRYDKSISEKFSQVLSIFTQSRYIYLINSGISSFYVILKALKEKSKKLEVILPAYTAGMLVVGIIKAGLKPVLCDISLKDFNLDRDYLLKVISPDTLAVVCVHMFGIGMGDTEQLRKKIPSDIFLIEDCAQAMGSRIGERQLGSFGDISFFSFNRGKNLPLYGGGCIITNSADLAERINFNYGLWVMGYGLWETLSIPFKVLAFSLAVKPLIYGLTWPFISRFKDIGPPKDFAVKRITNFQAGLGSRLLKKMDEISSKRYQNGKFLINALKGVKGIILPEISEEAQPAFNRLPIVFKDLERREEVERRLWRAGIETSRMYLKPLHCMFNLGYAKEDFPNANYFAQHLLTLPVHPLVREKDLLRMIEIIKDDTIA